MSGPTDEEDFSGSLQIKCDYETYRAFWDWSENFYTHEHALRELLRVVEDNPEDELRKRPPRWG